MKRITLGLFLILSLSSVAWAQTLVQLVENIKSSFRGMAAYGNKVVWVSGSEGTVGYSKDQGQHWHWVNPKGYETLDFRDIAVFSAKEAVVMSAGSPAVILRTTDAGQSWIEVFRDDRPEVFLDAIAFEGRLGYALGDPIDGLFQLLRTNDRGKTWRDVGQEMVLFADEGEVAFAASGSSIQLLKNVLYIGTGGKYSSFFAYNPKALRVDKYDCPILSGQGSAGIFAIDFWDSLYGIAVGGDYMRDQINSNNILLTNDGGVTWTKPQSPVSGYKSDVQFISKEVLLATGTSGTDVSYDGGLNWKRISEKSFNVLAKNKNSKIVYLAGSDGDVYSLLLK
jgi:photosystem II stability/assembly factor-like uncharacterized protein